MLEYHHFRTSPNDTSNYIELHEKLHDLPSVSRAEAATAAGAFVLPWPVATMSRRGLAINFGGVGFVSPRCLVYVGLLMFISWKKQWKTHKKWVGPPPKMVDLLVYFVEDPMNTDDLGWFRGSWIGNLQMSMGVPCGFSNVARKSTGKVAGTHRKIKYKWWIFWHVWWRQRVSHNWVTVKTPAEEFF